MFFRSTVLLAAAVPFSLAQHLENDTIGTCRDINCPSADGPPSKAACHVTNRTHDSIGVKKLPAPITKDQEDLTWTVGSRAFDGTDPSNKSVRKVEKDFYLGTPPSLNLTSNDLPYQGCAIIISGNSRFGPERGSQDCDSVIGTDCRASLLEDALRLLAMSANRTDTTKAICEQVQQGLNNNFTSACSDVVGKDSWGMIKAFPLTGDSAPKPPDASSNESSTCHPTLPKSNDLSFVFGFNETGTVRGESTQRMISGVNMILTAFWSADTKAEGAIEFPDLHLSCLWPIYASNQETESMSPSRATRVTSSSRSLAAVSVVVLCFFLLV